MTDLESLQAAADDAKTEAYPYAQAGEAARAQGATEGEVRELAKASSDAWLRHDAALDVIQEIHPSFSECAPMFACLGDDAWYDHARTGAPAYEVTICDYMDGNGENERSRIYAFLDRADAEALADRTTLGEYTEWNGTNGRQAVTAREEARIEAREPEAF